jgi:hypothetical protein
MRVEAKRKERDELEEEREDLLDLYVALESYAHKRACIDLIAEVDACLDGGYNAHEAAKEYPRMRFNANLASTYNCITLYVFKPDQIRSIRDAWMRRMPAGRDQVWIRLPAKLKLKKFTWEEGILCFLYRLTNIQTFRHQIESPKHHPKKSAQRRLPQSDLPQQRRFTN